MASDDGSAPRKRRRVSPPTAPYLFRPLLEHVPLSADGSDDDARITCVEYWNDNLYIGTSSAEILHFVCFPPDPSDQSSEPSFILASRLPIPHSPNASIPPEQRGIQQIVLLPAVGKACVRCNGTATFYLLPELSPAFGNLKINNCCWIGGLDQNAVPEDEETQLIMIAVQNKTMLVQIGDGARLLRNIEFPGCLAASRRGFVACAADANSYSLLDVQHQQKIHLLPISFLSDELGPGPVEDVQGVSLSPPPQSSADGSSHGRSSSLNTLTGMLQSESPPGSRERASSLSPIPSPNPASPRRSVSRERENSASPRGSSEQPPSDARKPLPSLPKRLKPHVLSPTATEFLLVRGTDESEPGVGMFFNVDGDLVRGTITFNKYPESLVIDAGDETNLIQSPDNRRDELIVALVDLSEDQEPRKALEVQPWDVDPAEAETHKSWVQVPAPQGTQPSYVGLRNTLSSSQFELSEVGQLLQMVRLKTPSLLPYMSPNDPRTQASIEQLQKERELFESQESTDSEGVKKGDSQRGWEAERNAEETKFARALGKAQSGLVLWSGNQIWRVVRNPLISQLNDALQGAQTEDENGNRALERDSIMDIIDMVLETEPRSEAEFLGLNYLKQKASLLLFGDLISMDAATRDEAAFDATERALITGDLDPRIALVLVPLLQREVLQGPQGIWIHAGLAQTADVYLQQLEKRTGDSFNPIDGEVLNLIKRFLLSWQQKRGYGSITDETYVFDSVDAALLHLLLEQDSKHTPEQRQSSQTRAQMNRLVDNWKGSFDRAVTLLEEYKRLFVLSRLYQSQKMSRNVLKTWRRIIEGEEDIGQEVTVSGAEAQMRRYLAKIKDAQLVEEYGSWLAGRNPKLGTQVFADSSSRVKLAPAEVVPLLKERAPNAVQVYLEHLVFSKNLTQYADDLLSYYLDTVLSVLETSPEARESLSESYSTYRALQPPKPTYMNFITANAPPEPWWQSRIRLLQLLGGSSSSSQFSSSTTPTTPTNLTYSIPSILSRIEPFQHELVSESVILDGLQGRHRDALHLLTHGLGDYDSAIRYCIFGGPSSAAPTDRTLQRELFSYLLDEFLRISDPSERIERSSDLLARFAAWFDVSDVLRLVPDDWSVDILSGFLAHVFRVLVTESREVRIERALSAALNLRIGTEFIDGVDKVGGWVEDAEGLRRLRDEPGTGDGEFGEMVNGS